MVHGENTTVIHYELRGQARSCTLDLAPSHRVPRLSRTTHENGALNPALAIEAGNVRVTPYRDLPSLYLAHEGGEVRESGVWYRNFEYDRERERGLDYLEDLFNPFTLMLDLSRQPDQAVIASTEAHAIQSASQLRRSEVERRKAILISTIAAELRTRGRPVHRQARRACTPSSRAITGSAIGGATP